MNKTFVTVHMPVILFLFGISVWLILMWLEKGLTV
jgi:hypothetical protein